jgi:hypothetical protein
VYPSIYGSVKNPVKVAVVAVVAVAVVAAVAIVAIINYWLTKIKGCCIFEQNHHCEDGFVRIQQLFYMLT